MKKTLISILASGALMMSTANAGEQHSSSIGGDIVQAGTNLVVNVGDLVVSFSQTALEKFPQSAVETANNLAKCLNDGLQGSVGQAVTAPVLCPITIGTEAATAIVLKGVSGVQSVIAVPAQFAKEMADIMLKASKESWEAMKNVGFWVVDLGVCVTSHVIGRAFELGNATLELVSSAVGSAMELVVNGVKTGIKYATDAVVMIVDTATGRAKIFASDLYGFGKGALITFQKTVNGEIGGDNGALKYFIDNILTRFLTLPLRLITGESVEEVIAQARAKGARVEIQN